MRKSLRINALMLATLLAADVAGAAGLRRLSVMSALGQPLKAEIELLSVPPEEMGNLSAKLASAEAFRQARLDRVEALSNVQFNITQRTGGQPVLRISSTTPVSDPFLDLLIELNWSSGRILREYTVLLDPPADTRATSEATTPVVPTSTAARQEQVKPLDTGATKKSAAKDAGAKESTPSGPPADASTYGPVKSGETLRAIASKVKPPEVSIDMMMAGLYQANKNAFARDNINLLKKGRTLAVPGQDAVISMFSPSQARDLVREHGAAWQAYRGQVADMAAKSAAPTPVDKKDGAQGKIVAAPAKDKVTPPAAPGADVLKLSKGSPAADAKAQQRQQVLEEELAAKGRSLKEANARVVQLEKTVKDMQQLIKLKDQQSKTKTPMAAPPVQAEKPTPAEPEKVAPEPVQALPPVPVAEEPSFIASLLEKPLYLGGALAALLLLLLGWMLLGRRRHSNLAQLEQSVINSGDDFKTAIFRTTAGVTTQAPAPQTSVMTDFSRLGLGAIDTHEVDPIAEAEVYMAYGRDAQAEEILKEALNKDAGRHEIALKLLEIYATRRDTAAFETQASEIYAALAGEPTPLWGKVTELGRSIDPNNPLYQFKGTHNGFPVAPEVAPYSAGADALREMAATDFSLQGLDQGDVAATRSESPAAMENLFTDEPVPMFAEDSAKSAADDLDGVIDFQLDLDTPGQGLGEDAESAAPLTESNPFATPTRPQLSETDEAFPAFDVGNFGTPTDLSAEPVEASPAAAIEAASEDVSPESLPDMDFSSIDLELSEPMPETPAVVEIEVKAPADVEAAADDENIDPEILEEVSTKLDLAKAYIEMGDKEGARETLEEALLEGNSQQKALARDLMASSA
ncbi:MAG: FimV family protein [Hydrogenophilales bacterium]|nr:FimV family protein [Hydrogenophilales bacterium]